MANAARSFSPFQVSNVSKSSDTKGDANLLTGGIQPSLRDWIGSDRDHSFPLNVLADLAYNDAAGYTAYFEATRPIEIGGVIYPGSTVPGTFSALTADIRVVKGDASDASAMYGDTPVSIFAMAG